MYSLTKNLSKLIGNRHFITGLTVLSIALLCFYSYRDILTWFFTATETLTLIKKGIIYSFNDVLNILTDDLMSGTEFEGRFYRPILVLSLGMDYSIWKLDPFGYHLTNILIHIITSITVFFFTRLLTKGKLFASWLSAVIFATHPIIMGAVIGIDKRNDTLATMFLMLSLITFLKYLSSDFFKKSFLTASLLFYAFAFGSKEIGVIVPLIIFSYFFIFTDETSPILRLLQTIKRTSPYILAAFILVAWRSYILKIVVGGYTHVNIIPDDIIILNFFNYLINPTGFMREFYSTSLVFLIPIIPVIISLIFYNRLISGSKWIRTLKIILLLGLITSSLCVIIYPFLIEPQIRDIYLSNSPDFIKNILSTGYLFFTGVLNVDDHSVAYYWQYRMLLLNRLYVLIFIFSMFLAGIANVGYIRENVLPDSQNNKLLTFLVLWILSPLSIYLFVFSLASWQMYIALIPFSIMLSVIFSDGLRSIKDFSRSSLAKHISVAAATCILFILFLYSTPIGFGRTGESQREWKDITKARSVFLSSLLDIFSELPNDTTTIEINGLPKNSWTPGYMVKSWFDLNYPDNNLKKIIINTAPPVETIPDCLDFEIKLNKIDDMMNKVLLKVKDCKNNHKLKTI